MPRPQINQGRPNEKGQVPLNCQLSEDAYRRIKQVDQQSSTLTNQGIQGFSARILDRAEYPTPDGKDLSVVQLIEIIKKPGQSLGLYLREGNVPGYDCSYGVFASRFGEGSELEKMGNIIRPGDEILNVNNVEVRDMSIDDVVYALSIPRRLVLRTRFLENRRDMVDPSMKNVEKPVIIRTAEDRNESDRQSMFMNPKPQPSILTKPARTASTWLGKRARQQQESEKQNHMLHQQYSQDLTPMSSQSTPPSTSTLKRVPAQYSNYSPPSVAQTAFVPPPKIWNDPYGENGQRFGSQNALGSQAENPYQYGERYCRYGGMTSSQPNPYSSNNVMSSSMGQGFGQGLGQNIGQGLGQGMNQALGQGMGQPLGQNIQPLGQGMTKNLPYNTLNPQNQPFNPSLNPQLNPMSSTMSSAIPPGLSQPYGNLNYINPALNPSVPPLTPGYNYKSNSLPRRRIQSEVAGPAGPLRSVKWRNDVISPGGAIYGGRSAMSDIASPLTQRRMDYAQAGRAHSTISSPGTTRSAPGRSVMDIFSAQEYRNWADPYGQPPDGPIYGRTPTRLGYGMRSTSLPSRTIINSLTSNDLDLRRQRPNYAQPEPAAQFPTQNPMERQCQILDRLHLSPLVNRRVPLRAAGPGFDVDQVSLSSLTGIITVWILEGRNLRIPDKNQSNQLYVVLEIDEVHRARTGISTPEQKFRWREGFEIDVQNAINAQFFVYSWHPQYRHRFCHKASMKLADAFFVDQLNGVRVFALNLEPKGQLMVRVAFSDMAHAYRRAVNVRYNASFGVPLNQLCQREEKETSTVFLRLITEIEKRGVDVPGLYYLSGALERKNYIKELMNRDPIGTDISQVPVPDINLLTCLVKDFLKELPEPLVLPNIYAMLVDASSAILPSDKEGNQGIMLKIVDCLSNYNKTTLIQLIDHIQKLIGSEPHNGLTMNRICAVFGPLIFCTNDANNLARKSDSEMRKVDLLDAAQATTSLKLVLENWPSRFSSENSSLDESANSQLQEQQSAATLPRQSSLANQRNRPVSDLNQRQPNGCVRFQVD
ncbi:unnamed protein product [Bursaphelenchus okinawaensis]|uniref:Uncharacterized protein n=1 Tax=Bursaphelenchus okinawaensis TaxID=465554 RepID=A0A811KAQ6_9BILA|nr:unnamed protein product [Bursaphelenchus okinawaensis]CAG9097815.1 unnamed protein product [Bursaphelenchus okinawaensis]